MRVPLASLVGLALFGAACGCQGLGKQRVERELRARETDVRELREELERSEAYNHQLFQELRGVRGDGCPLPPGVDHSIGLSPVRSLVLGRQTSGHSSGACAGDDGVQIHLEPRDPEGQAVKIGGSLTVQVLEINKEGLKKPISSWDIGPDQLRKAWKNGLLSSGYVLNLPWKIWPTTDKLRVVALFRPVDGRVFEAEKDITVRLPPPDQRRPIPQPENPAGVAPGLETLPVPKPVDPPPGENSGPLIDSKIDPQGVGTVWRSVSAPPSAALLRPVARP